MLEKDGNYGPRYHFVDERNSFFKNTGANVNDNLFEMIISVYLKSSWAAQLAVSLSGAIDVVCTKYSCPHEMTWPDDRDVTA